MKNKLLYFMLLAVFTISGNAQTFDWETATVQSSSQNPNSSVSQVISGRYFVGFNTPNLTPILLTTAGQGSSGLSVRNQQNEPSVRIGLNESVGTTVNGLNIQSIKVFDVQNNQNWTFNSLDAQGNVLETTTATVGQNAVVVTLNWTNVQLIEITRTNGSHTNFGVDDIVFTPTTPVPPIIYVNHAATGNNDGTSWANAYTSLQDAISIPANQIWIAQGIYKPSTNSRTASFNIIYDNVKIYGGFSGNETHINQKDINNNVTILSGDINGDDAGVFFTGFNRGDNSYHVAKINGNNILLDGIQINDGHADLNTNENNRGSAIIVNPAVNGFTVKNCKFKSNVSTSGGAIFAYFNTTANVVIEKCVFNKNLSVYGSGLYLLTDTSATLNISVSNSLFNNNESTDAGSTLGISGSAMWVRSIGTSSQITATISNCTFANNFDRGSTANSQKGPVALSEQDANSQITAVINNCIFYHNRISANPNNTTASTAVNRAHKTLPVTLTVNNSIDENAFSNLTSGTTSILSSNPLFTSTTDYTLQSGSPAIDAGNNTFVIGTTDLAGNQRVFNTTVDMGAYEFGAAAPITRTLTINATNGTVATNPNPTNGTYADGTVVALTATPATGYQFDGWSGDVTGTTNPVNITMDADKTVTATFSQQCLVNIPDANFKNYLVGNTAINTNGDTEIQCSEANTFTGVIYAGNINISDLTGIEAFTNITELECGENQLTSLNVTQNTALTMLRCADNQLTSLDVSQNTALTELYLQDNQITSLDVSQNTLLQYFYCYNNQLTSLDISQNTMLMSLQVYNNQLTSLDLSQNTALTLLDCANNQLTNLNIANGNNPNINIFNARNNANLTCIQIDAGFTPTNWQKDATASYSTNCSPQRTLTLNATNGTIATNPNPTNGTYADGTVVALTATPATGYQFDGWSGDATGTTNPINITMDADKTVTATFSLIPQAPIPTFVNSPANISGAYTATINFSSNVTGFDMSDIQVTGATLSNFTTVSGTEYTVVVTPTSICSSTVTLQVPANVAQGSNSINNVASAVTTINTVDNVDPTVIAQDFTLQLDANGQGTLTVANIDNGSTDNCAIATRTLDKTSFTCTDIGANTVTLTVTDTSGNISDATVTVTVVDNVVPIAAVQNIIVQLGTNGQANITTTDINNGSSDNCAIAAMSIDKTNFTCNDLGANNVILTVEDASGNQNTATATVTVTQNPNAQLAAVTQNITVQLDANGNATITPAQVDNGSGSGCNSNPTLSLDITSFDCSNIGTNTVTLTATDSGTSATATATVTVEDKMAPTVIAQDFTLQLDANGQGTLTVANIDNGSTDNCAIATRTLNKTSFTCTDIGANTVTLTIVDVNDNTASSTATVTLIETEAPTVITQNITTTIDANGNVTITPQQIDNGSSDACSGIASMSLDQSSFNCPTLGDVTVTLTVTDNNGNSGSKTAIVTITGPDEDNDGISDPCDSKEVILSKGFSPNGDGVNDTWVIENIDNYPNNKIEVFNRWGEKIYQVNNYQNDWDAKPNQRGGSSDKLPVGSYYYIINLNEPGVSPIQGWLYINY